MREQSTAEIVKMMRATTLTKFPGLDGGQRGQFVYLQTDVINNY